MVASAKEIRVEAMVGTHDYDKEENNIKDISTTTIDEKEKEPQKDVS